VHLNCGAGSEVSIRELVERVCHAVGFQGELVFDTSKPNGISTTYRWFLANRLGEKQIQAG
jgi:nucleoside-diphosphate-sugar epimerase